MPGRKRNINLFLMDGEANGIIKITTRPWNGLLLRIPRDRLYSCGERDEMKYSSIYFLIGPSESEGLPSVYVGQVGMRGILKRLTEHDKNPEKNYWTEAIVLTTSDNGLESTELNFLEHTFYNLACNSKQCVVKNAVEPNPGNVKEETISGIEETIEVTRIILEALGYKIFTPTQKCSPGALAPSGTSAPVAVTQAAEVKDSSTEKKFELNLDGNKKIGKFVLEDFVPFLQAGIVPLEEIEKLTSLEYCKKTFEKRVYFPILIEWPEGTDRDAVTMRNGYKRYYSDVIIQLGNKRYLISSQWYRETYAPLLAWCKQFI